MSETQKILFIGLSCVGDAVMTTPVLRALHEAYPDAGIDIVADSKSSDIFEYCAYRGKVIYKDKKRFLRGAPALLSELRKTNYELIVDLRTDGLTMLMRGKKKLTKRKGESYGPHAIEGFMGVIKSVHGDNDIPATTIWITQQQRLAAEETLRSLGAARVLAMAPGCGGKNPKKFWQLNKYAQLANNLSDNFDGVLLLGSKQDSVLTREIAKQVKLPLLDLAGKTDLLEAAALLEKATVFVGSDSGLGHVAGAMGTSTLSFFSVDKPARCLPWGPFAQYLEGEEEDARNITVQAAEKMVREAIGR